MFVMFLSSLINSDLILAIIFGVVIILIASPLLSLYSQKIIISNQELIFKKKDIFKDQSLKLKLNTIVSIKQIVRRGRYDLVENYLLEIFEAVNMGDSKLYIEKKHTLDLSLWHNNRVKEVISFLKVEYPSIKLI